MSDEIRKERSPSCPKLPLDEAVDLIRKLYSKVGRSAVKQEVAVGPLGYSGINGASLGTIAAISQYGLLERGKAGSVSVSNLALQLLHPTSQANEFNARQTSAKSPRIFAELLEGGFAHCEESALTNQLIHSGFTPDGARRAAYVFKRNVEYADLKNDASKVEEPSSSAYNVASSPPSHTEEFVSLQSASLAQTNSTSVAVKASLSNVAELPIPLEDGICARIPYPMTEESFDLLLGTLQLWKKKLVTTPQPKNHPEISP